MFILTFHSVLTTMQETEGLSRWRQEPQDWYQPASLWWVLVNTEKWDSRRYSSIEWVRWEGWTAEGSTSIRMNQDAGWGDQRHTQQANKAKEALFCKPLGECHSSSYMETLLDNDLKGFVELWSKWALTPLAGTKIMWLSQLSQSHPVSERKEITLFVSTSLHTPDKNSKILL